MIGALAIKRRRKKTGPQEVVIMPVKSRHFTSVYLLGGVAFITGAILLIPALIVNDSSTLFVMCGSLLGGGLLVVCLACCLSEWSETDAVKVEHDEKSVQPQLTAINGRNSSVISNRDAGDDSSSNQLSVTPGPFLHVEQRHTVINLPLVEAT